MASVSPSLRGKQFGRWTVLTEGIPANGKNRWICCCLCGQEKSVDQWNLTHGGSISCGCYRADRNFKHGKTQAPEFRIWADIQQRCHNHSNRAFKNYGARGIIVCQEWRVSFAQFLLDMGERPTASHSIERIDNNGNYEPANCQWATKSDQDRNKRTNRIIEFGDRSACVAEWAEVLRMNYSTLSGRLHRNWPVERAFFEPVKSRQEKLPLEVAGTATS